MVQSALLEGVTINQPFSVLSAGITMRHRIKFSPVFLFKALPFKALLFIVLALSVGSALALDATEIRAKLHDIGLDIPLEDVIPSEAVGYFEVRLSNDRILYVNDTGEYLFSGDLYLIQPNRVLNATEARQAKYRRELLTHLDESEMIVFSPPPSQVKARITVFTDIDCTYCRKLHREILEFNHRGIAVRYLAYPRTGYGSASWDKAVSVWCATDRQLALTGAKAGKTIKPLHCAEHPVEAHYALGQDFGVTGTPAIVYENGTLQSGYLPAQEMARQLGINVAEDSNKAGSE